MRSFIFGIVAAVITTLPVGSAYAQLDQPEGLAFDSSGGLWVANYGNNTVLKLDPSSGALLHTVSGNALSGPTRIAFDASDNLYVVNSKETQLADL